MNFVSESSTEHRKIPCSPSDWSSNFENNPCRPSDGASNFENNPCRPSDWASNFKNNPRRPSDWASNFENNPRRPSDWASNFENNPRRPSDGAFRPHFYKKHSSFRNERKGEDMHIHYDDKLPCRFLLFYPKNIPMDSSFPLLNSSNIELLHHLHRQTCDLPEHQ